MYVLQICHNKLTSLLAVVVDDIMYVNLTENDLDTKSFERDLSKHFDITHKSLRENGNLKYRTINAFVCLVATCIYGLVDVAKHPSYELRFSCKVSVKRCIHRHGRDNACQLVLDCFCILNRILLRCH